jgi:hypothetical protein
MRYIRESKATKRPITSLLFDDMKMVVVMVVVVVMMMVMMVTNLSTTYCYFL